MTRIRKQLVPALLVAACAVVPLSTARAQAPDAPAIPVPGVDALVPMPTPAEHTQAVQHALANARIIPGLEALRRLDERALAQIERQRLQAIRGELPPLPAPPTRVAGVASAPVDRSGWTERLIPDFDTERLLDPNLLFFDFFK